MESKEIKEKRRKKFLDKFKSQNNQNTEYIYDTNNKSNHRNKNKNNDIPLINDTTPIYKSNSSIGNDIKKSEDGDTLPNINNNIIENNIENYTDNNNKNNKSKIDYDILYKKINKYDYFRNLFNLMKKIFVMILSLFHCFNIYNLYDTKIFKNTLLIIEITSLFIDIILNNIIKRKVKNIFSNKDDNVSKSGIDFPIYNYLKIVNKYLVDLSFLDYIFKIYNVFMDVLVDIAIIFVVNFIFFIIHEENE